jgi:hypothetical protein
MTKKQVKDLKAGDDLGGTVLISDPINIGDYCGQKNRMQVNVRYSNGKESTRIWGRYTTVSVKDKQTSLN